ncbi:MAG: hypothetical protein OHK0012_20960 [Synechococcales cyanobacterium]
MAVSEQFRQQLAKVLDQWVSEDLISPEQRQRLRDYYQLDQLTQRAGGTFTLILLILGGILIGLGIISFVAANWDMIPRSVRAVVAVGLTLGLQWQGYALWRTAGRWQRLGTALLLVGELALGASIGLVAQWFQVSGHPSGLFLGWGIGVLAVAYGIRHTPSAVLAVLLIAPGYFVYSWERVSWIYHPALLPWWALVIVMPLAYWCRSRLVWFLSVGLLGVGMSRLMWLSDSGTSFTWGLLLYAALLWGWCGWHQRWLPRLHLRLRLQGEAEDEVFHGLNFLPITTFMAMVTLLGALYGWSFWFSWRWMTAYELPTLDLLNLLSLWGLVLLTMALWLAHGQEVSGVLTPDQTRLWQRIHGVLRWVGGLVAVAVGLGLIWRQAALPLMWLGGISLAMTGLLWIALALWISPQMGSLERMWWRSQALVGLAWLTLTVLMGTGSLWGTAVIWVNLMLVLASGAFTWQGLQRGSRWRFWVGLLFLSLTVVTRFFEYDTGLLLKSLALILCGVGVITAGLRFEQMLMQQKRRPTAAQPPHQPPQ